MGTVPTAQDVISFLESYDLQTTKVVNSEVVTVSGTPKVINVGGGVGYIEGDMIKFSGNLPTPLVAGNTYFAIPVSPQTINVASTYENALLGVGITLSTLGSGTIVLQKLDYYFLSQDWINKRMENFVIPIVERVIGAPVGRTEQVIDYYSGQGKNLLILNHRNIISLDAISYVLSSNYLWLLTLDAVEVIKSQGILKARRSVEQTALTTPLFPKGDKNIKCTMTVGWLDVPNDIREAILYFTAEQALGFIGSRTGGGASGGQVAKSFGARGMYTEVRNDLARDGHALLNKYLTGIVGA